MRERKDVKERSIGSLKRDVKKFLNTHRNIELSAAKLEYSFYLYGEASEKVIEFANGMYSLTAADLEMEKVIAEAAEPEELLKLMRKELSGSNKSLLRKKIMEHETELLSEIQEKCIRNKQSVFIENALYFFMKSEINYCDWIIETYPQFESGYLKSMLCLVLGFRGNVGMIPFLMEEAERMEKEYPGESFDQGPTLAVQELAVCYLN